MKRKRRPTRAAGRVERIVRFDPDLYGRLKELAETNRRSANAEIVLAVERHLEQ